MFIGHFGAGLIAKKISPGISLGILFLAAQFIDLLWPTLLLFGVETVSIVPGITKMTPFDFTYYPYSHSILAVTIWGILMGGAYFIFSRNRKGAVVIALLVISHWFLDLLVHRPDLPITLANENHVGLGLWNFPPVAIAIEVFIFVAGIFVYSRITQATDKIGNWAFWSLIIFLSFSYAGNLFGEPPPDSTMIAWVGQAQWLIVIWAFWIDAHRTPKQPPKPI